MGLLTGCRLALILCAIGVFILVLSSMWFLKNGDVERNFGRWMFRFAFPFTSVVVIVSGWISQ